MHQTIAYKKISELNKKIRVIQGGQGASKTFSILQIILIKIITEQPAVYTVVTSTYPQLRDGVIADFKNIFKDAGLNWDNYYKKGNNTVEYLGSQVQFRHVDNSDFHKGKGSRRDYLFINEANRVNYASVEQMMARTSKTIWIDFNPDREFWVHENILKGGREDVDFIILTYKDNSQLPDGERKEIEMRRGNKNWWRVYGEGQLGVYSDRQIYSYEWIDKIPETAKRINSGMDFGLSPDPTTLIDLYIDGEMLIADEVFTENNLMPEKIAGAERMSIVDKMDEIRFPKTWLIFADSASRTSIQNLRNNGYRVYPVKKYSGAIIDGIKIIKSYDLYLTRRSVGIKSGIENWFFKLDENGKIIPEPEGHEPDQLAAIRYAMLMHNRKKTFTI